MKIKLFHFLCLIFLKFQLFAQVDSLKVGDKYWEDQLYLSLTYNILQNQPSGVSANDISYGISGGYIKDFPLNKKGSLAIGIGIGYAYDYFKNDLIVTNDSFAINSEASASIYKFHSIVFPLQLRWRSSDAITYSFWRVYLGFRPNYNLFNKFSYDLNGNISNSNIESFNRFQNGLELSIGYDAFNLFIYYGLSDVFNDAFILEEQIQTRVLKLGLIFYLL